MKLYYSPAACSLAPHIALTETEQSFALVKVDLFRKKTAEGADFYKINPKGYVPTLQLQDGSILTECVPLLQYIGDLQPSAALNYAAGTMERYRVTEWLAFINSEVHKAFGPISNPASPDAVKDFARKVGGMRMDYLQSVLASQEFLMGERFTVADIYLFAVARRLKRYDLNPERWPAVRRFCERIAERPRVAAALAAEGQKSTWVEALPARPTSGA